MNVYGPPFGLLASKVMTGGVPSSQPLGELADILADCALTLETKNENKKKTATKRKRTRVDIVMPAKRWWFLGLCFRTTRFMNCALSRCYGLFNSTGHYG